MQELPYYRIPEPPPGVSAGTVLSRLIDGLGFRYRWATEGLAEAEMEFRPGPASMSLRDLLAHLHGLVARSDEHFGGPPREPAGDAAPPTTLVDLRAQTLDRLESLSARLAAMSEAEIAAHSNEHYPFWYMINGPLADALTHVGQVNAWRRLAGNPCPKARVFWGTPPGETG